MVYFIHSRVRSHLLTTHESHSGPFEMAALQHGSQTLHCPPPADELLRGVLLLVLLRVPLHVYGPGGKGFGGHSASSHMSHSSPSGASKHAAHMLHPAAARTRARRQRNRSSEGMVLFFLSPSFLG